MAINWIECLVKINLWSKEMTHRQWNARQMKNKKQKIKKKPINRIRKNT
jgi:hypothetical protein